MIWIKIIHYYFRKTIFDNWSFEIIRLIDFQSVFVTSNDLLHCLTINNQHNHLTNSLAFLQFLQIWEPVSCRCCCTGKQPTNILQQQSNNTRALQSLIHFSCTRAGRANASYKSRVNHDQISGEWRIKHSPIEYWLWCDLLFYWVTPITVIVVRCEIVCSNWELARYLTLWLTLSR